VKLRAGLLLAGGKSSRMGTDKAFLDLAGQSLLNRALDTLSSSRAWRQPLHAVCLVPIGCGRSRCTPQKLR